MKDQHIRHLLELNIAVLLISTSGVLGRYISMPPPITIWWRCFLSALILGAFCRYKKIDLKITNIKDWNTIVLSGLLFGAHWVTYFYALKLSNVAIGMLSLFTFPVITALLEPIFFKIKFNAIHILLGALVIVGIYFLTPEFNIDNNYTIGIFFGLTSSVFYALRNLILKKKIAQYHGSMLMFYQMVIISLVLWPSFFIFNATPSTNDWGALIILAIVTTAIGHTLFVMSFNNFSVSTASIISSIQPVYGILFGFLLLNEIPTRSTIIGGSLILTTVVIESIQSKKI